LRPDSGKSGVFSLRGPYAAVSQAAASVLATCWIHWFDAVDVLFDGGTENKPSRDSQTCLLRISLNCPTEEWPVYEQFLKSFSVASGLAMTSDTTAPLLPDGCPDFALKTTPDRAIKLAHEITAHEDSIKCIALCYNGVVHGYLNPSASNPQSRITNIIQRHLQALHEVGGDWQSRHIPHEAPADVEAKWLKLLEQEFASV
jgi:hypothetical protein